MILKYTKTKMHTVTSKWVAEPRSFHQNGWADRLKHGVFFIKLVNCVFPNFLSICASRKMTVRPCAHQLINISVVKMITTHRRFQYRVRVCPPFIQLCLIGDFQLRKERYELYRFTNRHCFIRCSMNHKKSWKDIYQL